MDERKTMFLAVGILLVAMLASSISPPLSGYNVMDNGGGNTGTMISISPNPVQKNNVITVTVTPGPNGVKNEWMWIERNGEVMTGTRKRICPDLVTKENVCYGVSTVNYLVGTNDNSWPTDATYTIRLVENVDQRSAGGIKQTVYATADFRIV